MFRSGDDRCIAEWHCLIADGDAPSWVSTVFLSLSVVSTPKLTASQQPVEEERGICRAGLQSPASVWQRGNMERCRASSFKFVNCHHLRTLHKECVYYYYFSGTLSKKYYLLLEWVRKSVSCRMVIGMYRVVVRAHTVPLYRLYTEIVPTLPPQSVSGASAGHSNHQPGTNIKLGHSEVHPYVKFSGGSFYRTFKV